MMVTETEMLTSILHHNIFTYLDYVFPVTFIYIYIYLTEPRENSAHKYLNKHKIYLFFIAYDCKGH